MRGDLNLKIKKFKSSVFFRSKKALSVIYSYLLFILLFVIVFALVFVLEDFFVVNVESQNSKFESYSLALEFREEVLSCVQLVNSSKFVEVKDDFFIKDGLVYIDSFNTVELLVPFCSSISVYRGEKYFVFYNGSCVQLLN